MKTQSGFLIWFEMEKLKQEKYSHKEVDAYGKIEWVSVSELKEMIESFKPVDDDCNLSESDKGYIEACNEIILQIQKTITNIKGAI